MLFGERSYLLLPDPDLPPKAVEQQDRRPFAGHGVEKGPLFDLRRLELEGGVPLKGGRPDERSATPDLQHSQYNTKGQPAGAHACAYLLRCSRIASAFAASASGTIFNCT